MVTYYNTQYIAYQNGTFSMFGEKMLRKGHKATQKMPFFGVRDHCFDVHNRLQVALLTSSYL